MSNPLLVASNSRWARTRRRWALTLGALLAIDASVVVIAVAGYSQQTREEVAAVVVQEESGAAAADAGAPLADAPVEPAVHASQESSAAVEPSAPPEAADAGPDRESTAPPAVAVAEPVGEVKSDLIPSAPVSEPTVEPAVVLEVAPLVPLPPVNSSSVKFTTLAAGDTAALKALVATEGEIVVVNPLENEGVVHFVFDGRVYSLEAGQYETLCGCDATQLVFHQGDDFDDVECDVAPGVYVFEVDSSGWRLKAVGFDHPFDPSADGRAEESRE